MNQVEMKRRQIEFLSYGLGCFNLWLFGKSIGDNGVAYLAAGVEILAFFWILAGCNVPEALGRMLRGRNAREQYRNVLRMRRNVMLLQLEVGILGSVLSALLGCLLVEKVFQIPYGRLVMLLLAPVILIRCVSSVLLGYFQGEGYELPAAISGILRQLLLLGFGLLFGGILQQYGKKVSLLLRNEDFAAMYGAAGVALAILLTELLLLLFLFLIYRGSKHDTKVQEDGRRTTESFGTQSCMLYRSMGHAVLRQLLLGLPLWLGLIFYQKSAEDIYASAASYGAYVGQYLMLCGLVAAVLCAGLFPAITRTAACVRKEEQRYAKFGLLSGMQGAVSHGLFFTIFFAVMAEQMASVLGGDNHQVVVGMLQGGSSLVLWGILFFYFAKILLLTGDRYFVLAALGIWNIVFTILVVLFLNGGYAGIKSLAYAGAIGSAAGCLLLGVFVCRRLRAKPDWLRTLAIPAGAGCLVGLLLFGFGKVLTPNLGSFVTLLVSLCLGTLLYWGLLLTLRCFRVQEITNVPGRRLISALGHLLRVW